MDALDKLLARDAVGAGDVLETAYRPAAKVYRHSPKRAYRRMAALESLDDVIAELPRPGETVHIVSDSKFDFWTWVPTIAKRAGRLADLYVSTWTLSRPNAVELLEMLDSGAIARTSFLTGTYFKRRETAVYSYLVEGLTERGMRYRAFQNHAKVMLIRAEDAGLWGVIEGSANLTANPRLEQYAFSNEKAIYEFHSGWMEEVFAAPGNRKPVKASPVKQTGYRHRRAGEGVLCYTNNSKERRRILGMKASLMPPAAYEIGKCAEQLAELVTMLFPDKLPAKSVVTTPPQGASAPGRYLAAIIARRLAVRLKLPFVESLTRQRAKTAHGIHASLDQGGFTAEVHAGRTYIVVDDLITTGTTMRNSLSAIRAKGVNAYGVACQGS